MKKLIIIAALLSLSNPCFAYNDYGYSYGVATPYSGGFDSSMRLRERENDFYRQQTLNQASTAATLNSLSNSSSQSRTMGQLTPSTSSSNTNRMYTVDKPLPLNGIYSYDAYGR